MDVWLRLLLALVASVIAVVAIIAHRRLTAQKGALDFITSYEIHNDEWLRLRIRASQALQTNVNVWFPTPGQSLTQTQLDQKQDLLTWLNHHEIIAIAIDKNVIDSDFYMRWFGSTFRGDWAAAEPFVTKIRNTTNNQKLFLEFERLASPQQTSQRERILRIVGLLLGFWIGFFLFALISL